MNEETPLQVRFALGDITRSRRLAMLLATCTALIAAGCASTAPGTAPARSVPVAGLEQPAEVLIDRWGVPHIYAGTLYDAFVAQGYVAARDRLWQMDLWRKRGLGQMAQDFGPAWVESDAAARSVLFRGDMYREWLSYGSDAKRVAEAFVAGVNAFVAQTEASPDKLPLEFRLLGYKPARWAAEDTVRIRHHGLTLNFTGEVDRAAAYCKGPDGVRADALRRETVPTVIAKVPAGLDPCALPGAELKRAYALATASPRFTHENLPQMGKQALRAEPAFWPIPEQPDANTLASYGSNNWTIAPRLTATGRPILANDPHRAHGAPSLRYISHISAPGMDVVGAGEPFLPGISIGHNGRIAFGLTRFYMDQEDLYTYQLNPANPREYRYQDRWEPMSRVQERIAVRGEAQPRVVENWYTRHGPVLHTDGKSAAFALRAAWLDLGMAPYFGSMDYMRAQNWDQFRAAMNRWGAPGENQVYADSTGNIGWIPGGLTPVRPNWDGLLPVPGDGRYEWRGYRHGDELPWEFNPARGYVVTANENNIPPQHPLYGNGGVGYEWADPARAQRLHAVFRQQVAAGRPFTLADSERMQTDVTAVPAQRLLRLLAPLTSGDADTMRALALLHRWDGRMAADSAAAALYEVWYAEALRPAVVATLPADVRPIATSETSIERIVQLLELPVAPLTAGQRDALLLSSLAKGYAATVKRLGSDPAAWQWGKLHRAVFVHPLADAVDPATRRQLVVSDWPVGGSASTPMATSYSPSNYQLTAGASFRMVLDVGRWDDSRVVNTPGQSGDPASPHYRDLAPLWAAGTYFPLLYSRQAVERNATERLQLQPGR